MPQEVFPDTSVIQYLHQLGMLNLLTDLFEKVRVPQQVYEEIQEGLNEGEDLPDLEATDFIEIVQTETSPWFRLVRDLGKGEISVLLLGLQNPQGILILDDGLARQAARELGLKVTGTAGLLIAAKRRGFIDAVRPYLDRLIELGFYLSPQHRRLILGEAGEGEPDSEPGDSDQRSSL